MKKEILAIAQTLVQKRGFSGFSYADVAQVVGIRKASLHHHFPSKLDLILALIQDYTAQLDQEFIRISSLPVSADIKLDEYAKLYRFSLQAERVCMGGMLATEVDSLDEAALASLRRFFQRNTEWLTEILVEGKSNRIFHFRGTAVDHARLLLSSFQGALILARATGNREDFERTIDLLISGLTHKG